MKKQNNGERISWLLTTLVILLPIALLQYIPSNTLLQYADIYSTIVAFIAFIWFYQSLYLQRIQLQEQREQFDLEFKQISQSVKREKISLAKSILEEMEKEAQECLEKINSETGMNIDINHLTNLFIEALKLSNNILESTEEQLVIDTGLKFNKYLNPIETILSGIKRAGIVVFGDEENINLNISPEEFVSQYQDKLISFPFFSKHIKNVALLAKFMKQFDSEMIDLSILSALSIHTPIAINKDKLNLLLTKVQKKGKDLPKITKKYLSIASNVSTVK